MNIEELHAWKGSKHDDLHLLWVLRLFGLPKDLRLLILTTARKEREQEAFAFQCSRLRFYNDGCLLVVCMLDVTSEPARYHRRQQRMLAKCRRDITYKVPRYEEILSGPFMHLCFNKPMRREPQLHLANCERWPAAGFSLLCDCNPYKGSYKHHVGRGCGPADFQVATLKKLK